VARPPASAVEPTRDGAAITEPPSGNAPDAPPVIAPSTPSPEAGAERAPQARAFFPYTIRPGDSPGSIAALFGITIADLMRANHLSQDTELIAGDTLRIPNPNLARERELTAQIGTIAAERQAAEQRAIKAENTAASLRAQMQDLNDTNQELSHDSRVLPWWRSATLVSAAAALVMLGGSLLILFDWLTLRGRFRAVAEMNEALRRLDLKYRALLAKAELRLQELYGRRRRGIQDGQERPKMPEEAEVEKLNRQLKEILEAHLLKLGPPDERARRARGRELVSGIGSPIEVRTGRR
jgi:LysM repeat protein